MSFVTVHWISLSSLIPTLLEIYATAIFKVQLSRDFFAKSGLLCIYIFIFSVKSFSHLIQIALINLQDEIYTLPTRNFGFAKGTKLKRQ